MRLEGRGQDWAEGLVVWGIIYKSWCRRVRKLGSSVSLQFSLLNIPGFSSFFFKKIIYFWLCWVFIAGWGCFSSCSEQGLVSRCGAQASHSSGFSRFGVWALAHMGLVVVAYGLACPAACGNFLPLGSNPCFTGRSDS